MTARRSGPPTVSPTVTADPTPSAPPVDEPRVRAAALPPGERRAAIVAATLPLLLRHGSGVTTRQIAEAAGIAEGTIFRVFPDKESLIGAVIETAFDPVPVAEALQTIDRTAPLEDRLIDAVEILRRRVTTIWELMTAVGMSKLPDGLKPGQRRSPPDLSDLEALFEPDRDRLAREPRVAADLLRALVFAGSHPALIADEPLSSTEIVSVLLDGIRTRPEGPDA